MIRKKVEPIYEKSLKESNVALHPIECTLFDDLLELINAPIFELSEEEPLTVGTLKELLSNCSSIQEVKKKLDEKTAKISYWDKVFSRYFAQEQWNILKECLLYVIEERNKVMHHRPIYHGAIAALETKQKQIFDIIDSAKKELTEQELQELKEFRIKIEKQAIRIFPQYWQDSFTAINEGMKVLFQNAEMIRKATEVPFPHADTIKAVEALSRNADMYRVENNLLRNRLFLA